MRSHFIYALIVSFMLTSCREAMYLQNDLNHRKGSLTYTHSKELINCVKTDTVIVKLKKGLLDSITRVSKMNRYIVPLLVFNYSELNMIARLGEASVEERYPDFFTTNLLAESAKTGCFYLSDKTETENFYTLDITIDTCKTNSIYRHNFALVYLGIAYFTTSNERAFEARANVKATVKLKKKGVLVFEKHYDINKHKPFLSKYTKHGLDNFRQQFVVNMCEALSLCSKECIENIIKDVNTTLHSK